MERHYISFSDIQLQSVRIKDATKSIFSQLYTSPISFPFDGFHTSKGNAAADCKLFIVNLIKGQFSHSWYTSQHIRMKNRADTVLSKKWKVLSRDGSVAFKPQNELISSIVSDIETQIKSGKNINLADLFSQYCLPPYTGNIASIGLILGVYCAPRHESLSIIFNGQLITLSQWLKEAFKGNYLDLEVLKKSHLHQLIEGPSDGWKYLLEEWKKVTTHVEIVNYFHKSKALELTNPVPSSLFYLLESLRKDAEYSENTLNNLKIVEVQHTEKLEKGISDKDICNISWAGADFVKLKLKLQAKLEKWTEEQIHKYDNDIEKARLNIMDLFPLWLKNIKPFGTNPSDLSQFDYKMAKVIENLEKLDMESEKNELQIQKDKIVKGYQRYQALHGLLEETGAWLKRHESGVPISRIIELTMLIEEINQYESKLNEYKILVKSEDIDNALSRFSKLKEQYLTRKQDFMSQASKIYDDNFIIKNGLAIAVETIESLKITFQGSDQDSEDFEDFLTELGHIKDLLSLIDSLQLSWKDFDTKIKVFIDKNKLAWENKDIPWSLEEIINSEKQSIIQKRNKQSKLWKNELIKESKLLEELNTSQLNNLLDKINTLPPYVTNDDGDELKALRPKVVEMLNTKKVDWLLEVFSGLSKDIQKTVYKKLSDMIK
ncbi:MAG: hypothetical protein JXB49_10930 [Bacteroidales bacterium]|nr:hypothetical protein [Bacteroidales bacterium]